MTEIAHFAFKHYQLPVTIIWNDPKEYFVKGMKTLLRDIEENGIERWTVKELKEEIKPVDSAPKEDDCCPPPTNPAQQGATGGKFVV